MPGQLQSNAFHLSTRVFSLSYFIAAPTCFIVSLGTFHCYFIPTLLQYFIISQPIFHCFPWDISLLFYTYPAVIFHSTLLQYFIISQPIFHSFSWDFSFPFHICPAAIFHYFPAHFSLFPLGHFIAISYP